jgi:hypothetical protein
MIHRGVGRLLAEEGVETLAIVRMGVGLLLLWDVATTFRHTIELYSTAGPALPMFPTLGPYSWWVPSPSLAVLAQGLLAFLAVAIVLGWRTRSSLLLGALLLVGLRPLDLCWTFAKPTLVWLHLLVLLACSGCGGWGSVDAALSAGERGAVRGSIWPRRLMQALACFIYLGGAVTKLNSPWFAGGELLQYSLLDRGWGGTALGQWLATSPRLVHIAALGTMAFELVFPCLVWTRGARPGMLAVAALFHTAIASTMHVGSFSATMGVLLLSFVEPSTWAGWWNRCPEAGGLRSGELAGRLIPRGVGTGWGWGAAAIASMGLGWAWQFQADWYGVFGRRDFAPLTRLSARDVAAVLPGRAPAAADAIHRMALGTHRGGREVWGSTAALQPGETLWVLVQFSPLHSDLRLTGTLWTATGDQAAAFEQKLPGGVTYSLHGFEITPEFPAGEGQLVLQLNGHDVALRRVGFAGAGSAGSLRSRSQPEGASASPDGANSE